MIKIPLNENNTKQGDERSDAHSNELCTFLFEVGNSTWVSGPLATMHFVLGILKVYNEYSTGYIKNKC